MMLSKYAIYKKQLNVLGFPPFLDEEREIGWWQLRNGSGWCGWNGRNGQGGWLEKQPPIDYDRYWFGAWLV